MCLWRLVWAPGALVLRANLVQNLLDAILARNGLVEEKQQLGRPPQPQPGPDLATEKRRARSSARALFCRAVLSPSAV